MYEHEIKPEHKLILDSLITQLKQHADVVSREARNEFVLMITDCYVHDLGYTLDDETLQRLTDLMLHEELTDTHPDKMSKNEYPILSPSQEARRKTGQFRHRTKRGDLITEVPLSHADNVGTDGKNHTPPSRKYTNPF